MELIPRRFLYEHDGDTETLWGIEVQTNDGKVIAHPSRGLHGPKAAIERICETDGECCPHDGGKCHHHCPGWGECFRQRTCVALTTPWPGFPLKK